MDIVGYVRAFLLHVEVSTGGCQRGFIGGIGVVRAGPVFDRPPHAVRVAWRRRVRLCFGVVRPNRIANTSDNDCRLSGIGC
mgnify:CR=1 FL=1